MSRGSWFLVGLMVLFIAWFGLGHLLTQSVAKSPSAPATSPPIAMHFEAVPDCAPLHGIAWQFHHTYSLIERAEKALPEIAELGADTVMLSVARYQENAASPTIYNDPERMPTEEQWKKIIAIAHKCKLRVVIMPIVLLSKPRGTEWRGEIQPPNWDEWFESYGNYIRDMAIIAETNHAEVLMVGSELVSTEKFGAKWKKLIADVRRTYKGKLSYSANWDHYKNIEYWEDLDLIGMTTYHKLSDDEGPTLEHLLDSWRPIQIEILDWQKTVRKPILFTEVGWCSQEGASVEAWNYYHKQKATKDGLEEQRRLYLAFMQTWGNRPEVGGAIWWEWNETPGGEDDYNYTPKAKPAEKELRRWFAERREAAKQQTAASSQKSGKTEDKQVEHAEPASASDVLPAPKTGS